MSNEHPHSNLNHNNAELGELLELITRGKQWEENINRQANQELYALLQRCAELYDHYSQCESKKAWKDALKTAAVARNIKLSTNFVRNIVRVVFGFSKNNYRRISTYGLALEAARTAGVQGSQVAQWLEAKGGVTEVSRSSKKPIVRKAEFVKQRLKAKLALPSQDLANLVDAEQQGEYIVFLARVDRVTVEIFDASASATSVNAMLNSLYKSYKDQPPKVEINPKLGKTSDEILAMIAQRNKLGEAA